MDFSLPENSSDRGYTFNGFGSINEKLLDTVDEQNMETLNRAFDDSNNLPGKNFFFNIPEGVERGKIQLKEAKIFLKEWLAEGKTLQEFADKLDKNELPFARELSGDFEGKKKLKVPPGLQKDFDLADIEIVQTDKNGKKEVIQLDKRDVIIEEFTPEQYARITDAATRALANLAEDIRKQQEKLNSKKEDSSIKERSYTRLQEGHYEVAKDKFPDLREIQAAIQRKEQSANLLKQELSSFEERREKERRIEERDRRAERFEEGKDQQLESKELAKDAAKTHERMKTEQTQRKKTKEKPI